jgi:transcription elongation factor
MLLSSLNFEANSNPIASSNANGVKGSHTGAAYSNSSMTSSVLLLCEFAVWKDAPEDPEWWDAASEWWDAASELWLPSSTSLLEAGFLLCRAVNAAALPAAPLTPVRAYPAVV